MMNYYLLTLNLVILVLVVYVFFKVRDTERTILNMRAEFIYGMNKVLKMAVARRVKEEIDKYGIGRNNETTD